MTEKLPQQNQQNLSKPEFYGGFVLMPNGTWSKYNRYYYYFSFTAKKKRAATAASIKNVDQGDSYKINKSRVFILV